MHTGLMKLKSLLFVLCLSAIVVACGDDDSSTSPTPTPKVTLNLPDNLVSMPFGYILPVNTTDKYKDVNWSTVSAYLGDYHPDNLLPGTSYDEITKKISFSLPTTISRNNTFIPYKNLNYNGIDCEPEDLARTISKVRFFSTDNNQKQYEIMIGVPVVSNPDVLTKEYHIYFWSGIGTATGNESAYTCNYTTKKGWNITEKDGNNLVIVNTFQGEIMFNVVTK